MQIYDEQKYFELVLEQHVRELSEKLAKCPIWDVVEEKRLEAVDVEFTD
jgi:hypothetical protein